MCDLWGSGSPQWRDPDPILYSEWRVGDRPTDWATPPLTPPRDPPQATQPGVELAVGDGDIGNTTPTITDGIGWTPDEIRQLQ